MQTPLLLPQRSRSQEGRSSSTDPERGRYLCPPQTVTYGTSIICFCIGCIWGLRVLGEIVVPWLGPHGPYTLNDCAIYALWCCSTALPCLTYLYAAESVWAAANDLSATEALRCRRVIWIAFASAFIKLALVITFAALSAGARGQNPYVQMELRIFMSTIIVIMLGLFVMSCIFVRNLKAFAKECDAPIVACLAETPL